jgi:polygalacturonase
MRDETRPDTARIQQALDHCPPGHAVELVTDSGRSAFLSGPLDLRPGVTLRIGPGAILFASRDPRDYDLAPGACGTLTRRGHGCKPLIGGDDAPNSAVMGPGTIDGRGWATLLDKRFSWWQLARQAI